MEDFNALLKRRMQEHSFNPYLFAERRKKNSKSKKQMIYIRKKVAEGGEWLENYKRKNSERAKKYYRKVLQDPAKRESFKIKSRAYAVKRYYELKADPVRFREYKDKKNAELRKKRAMEREKKGLFSRSWTNEDVVLLREKKYEELTAKGKSMKSIYNKIYNLKKQGLM